MSVDNLLSRLARVRQLPDGQWQASCPTTLHKHGDRSAGLRIKHADDGKILLKCFAGCQAEEITEAVGLRLSDLFPPRPGFRQSRRRSGGYITRDQYLAVALDAMTCTVALDDLLNGKPLTDHDAAVIQQASARLYRFAQKQAGVSV